MESGRDCYLKLFRYYHTLKNLKPVQIYGRVLFALKRKFRRVVNNKRVAALAEGLKETLKVKTDEKIKFCFLNKDITFKLSNINWTSADIGNDIEKLWVYNLNYFNWLISDKYGTLSNEQACFLVLDWISQNTDELSEPWEPYPLSKRITAWTKWLDGGKIPQDIASAMKSSIILQLKRLYLDLEYHNQANHLLENLRGFVAGCRYIIINAHNLFTNELEYQLENVLDELITQISMQFLNDGAHYERSPMYHCEMLEAIEDISSNVSILKKQLFLLPSILEKLGKLEQTCSKLLPKMDNWLELMTMPDGEVAQFNDCERVFGIEHTFNEHTELLSSSGFFVRHKDNNSFIMSCGEPSPSYQPGHTHCDIFSYELAVNGNRIIIDTGCGSYQNKNIRQLCRETEAHNLPLIQHQEQSDIWESFRIGKRAKIAKRTYDKDNKALEVIIEDQYSQVLERQVVFSTNKVKIYDTLLKRTMTGCFISLIHLAPGIKIESQFKDKDKNLIECVLPKGQKFSIITEANVRISDYISFPEFGKSISAKMLTLSNKESETIDYAIKW